MSYKYKLVEQEMDGDNAMQKASYDLVLTPTVLSTEEVVKALENIDNYGAYVSNLRNSSTDANKASIAHFGGSDRFIKLAAKKFFKESNNDLETFKNIVANSKYSNKLSPYIEIMFKSLSDNKGDFPLNTKIAQDNFLKTLKSKPTLLNWTIKGEVLHFPTSKNPSKQVTKNIIDTVMNNAGIDYTIEDKEAMSENSLREVIKEIIRKNIKK
jgi:hypothetical protein